MPQFDEAKDIDEEQMRTRISDSNIFPTFSLDAEYQKLHQLFHDNSAFGKTGIYNRMRPSISYAQCLDLLFLDWNLRGTFTSYMEMVFALGISEDHFTKDVTEERLLDYIQFIINATCFVDGEIRKGKYSIYQNGESIFNAIADNSMALVNKLGAEIKNDGKELFIVYKDDVAVSVAEQQPDLEASIVEYLKIDNRGDIVRKGEVLCTLSKKLEPLEKKLEETEFSALKKDTTFLLNKAARHGLNENDPVDKKFLKMSDAEFEQWQDRAFQLFLACMAGLPYIDFKSEIKDLRKR